MFSPDMKHMIAEQVQKILQSTFHSELPKGEVFFLLHVDGADSGSWANIRNNGSLSTNIPPEMDKNRTIQSKVFYNTV